MDLMAELPATVGHKVAFAKTVSEADVVMFAGISGDFAPVHVNEEYMAKTAYKKRIAHGALMVAYMSAASTKAVEHLDGEALTAVSLGYDRVRFVAPVFLGDTVTVHYTIAELDAARNRGVSDIEVTNQDGTVVAVARHLVKWVENE